MPDSSSGPAERHALRRVRHELRRRTLYVTRIQTVTPRMRRIHFGAPELADFTSLSPDDHVKLFFPAEDGSLVMRDFTPRLFDAAALTLAIDFALHEAGPAASWARDARVGQSLQIGGPRGSRVLPDDFDWYWLIGDESALPAIGRRVEELRAGVPVTSVVAIADAAERQTFSTRAAWRARWVERGEPGIEDAQQLIAAVSQLPRPAGEGYVWIAGEASLARALRAHVQDELHHSRAWLRAAGYWQRGQSGAHVELGE